MDRHQSILLCVLILSTLCKHLSHSNEKKKQISGEMYTTFRLLCVLLCVDDLDLQSLVFVTNFFCLL